jgi:hypothetical protein
MPISNDGGIFNYLEQLGAINTTYSERPSISQL